MFTVTFVPVYTDLHFDLTMILLLSICFSDQQARKSGATTVYKFRETDLQIDLNITVHDYTVSN